MKKIIAIIITIIFCSGIVFAQINNATVTETGANNTAYIDQLGGTLANPNNATITQVGDKNIADVSDMYASSLFGLLTGTNGIIQQGVGNTGLITQTNLFSSGVSAGPIAGIGQYNDHNSATINQSGNTAWMQGYVWVKQTGQNNTSLQNQEKVSYAYSHVYQTGNYNSAETQQPMDGYNQRTNILQSGDCNTALQYQGSAGYTHDNLAEVTQSGDQNQSWQYQYGSSNTAKTIQSSDWNFSNLIQNGNLNDAMIEQKTGDINTINLTQSDGAQADILQDGNNNIVQGLLADPMATSLNGSTLNVDQVGSFNVLHLQQTNGASATVSQDGITNTAVVIQN